MFSIRPDHCCHLLLLFCTALVFVLWAGYVNAEVGGGSETVVLVPHGEDPSNSKDRMVIQRERGQDSPYPCVVSGSGMYEHGQTFSKSNKGSEEKRLVHGRP